MKFRLSKEEWPWCTSSFSMCTSGWKYWSALMEHHRANGYMFTVVSCIPHGRENSHAERWASQTGVSVAYTPISSIGKKLHESAVISLSTSYQSDDEIIEILPYFKMANIVMSNRPQELNSTLCKQIQKQGFAWGLDDGCHGTELFCSKVGLE